jgi:hypothetical protein
VVDGRLDSQARSGISIGSLVRNQGTDIGTKSGSQVLANALPVENVMAFRHDGVFRDVVAEPTNCRLHNLSRKSYVFLAFQNEIGMACLYPSEHRATAGTRRLPFASFS